MDNLSIASLDWLSGHIEQLHWFIFAYVLTNLLNWLQSKLQPILGQGWKQLVNLLKILASRVKLALKGG
jgi:hypothetical protein